MRAAECRKQRGVVLFIALIVLVAMSLAGIALMRSVDTGTIVAGNLAFRQGAMHVGDIGIEAARSWLQTQSSASLYNDIPASAYYAGWAQNVVLVGTPSGSQVAFDWSTAAPVVSPAPPAGYSVSYVIHRLCESAGDPASITCVKQTGAASASGGGTKGAAAFGQMAIQVPTSSLYRITVRVVGPRNSTSFVQAVVF
jgi:Tfp pilus assembly protein PilX